MVMLAARTESDRDPAFADWIRNLDGAERIRECIHCGVCSASCPLARWMDYSPRRIMHLAREGFKNDVLESHALWLCTSCYECTVRCPREIPVTEVMYALKARAIAGGSYPRRFPVPVLARAFARMVRREGRISEGRLAMWLMLKTSLKRLLGMSRLAPRLLRTGRLALHSDHVAGRDQVVELMDAVTREQNKEVGA